MKFNFWIGFGIFLFLINKFSFGALSYSLFANPTTSGFDMGFFLSKEAIYIFS